MFNFSLLWELTKRDFTEQYAGSVLGSLWAILWPLANLCIYIIVFGRIMGSRLPGRSDVYAYSIYLVVGLVPWTAFAGTISRSSSVFFDKKHIITKIRTSLPALLIYITLSESITFIISMGIFFAFLLVTRHPLHLDLLMVPFIYYLQQLFACGFGLLAATLTVFVRDLKEMIGILLQFWFWFTPIVYVRDILPQFAQKLVTLNPAYLFIECYHRIFVFNTAPAYRTLIALTVLTHIMICVSYVTFRALEKDVRDFL